MRGYIVPKEKPQHCARCPYIDAESLDCTLLKGSRAYETLPEQYKTCPLIDVEIEDEVEAEAVVPIDMLREYLRRVTE